MIGAAIHPGSCVDPAPTAAVVLNGFTSSVAADDRAAPLMSYTEAPVVLSELLAAPHAVLATLGGDVDAELACGELGNTSAGGTLSVDLREQNDSGYTGVGLLTASDGTTRVSLVLAEQPVGLSDVTPPPPPGTPGVAPGTPGVLQPPAVTPPGPPTPPAIQTPAEPGSPHVSQEFGFSIDFDPSWSIFSGPSVEPGRDYLMLTNGTSFVDFFGGATALTPAECMDALYQFYIGLENLRSLVARAGTDTEPLVSTPERAVEVWDLVFADETGATNEVTIYSECRVLAPGQSHFFTTHEAPRDQYEAQALLREQLYAGLTFSAD
jgi:hypothetical protein